MAYLTLISIFVFDMIVLFDVRSPLPMIGHFLRQEIADEIL